MFLSLPPSLLFLSLSKANKKKKKKKKGAKEPLLSPSLWVSLAKPDLALQVPLARGHCLQQPWSAGLADSPLAAWAVLCG